MIRNIVFDVGQVLLRFEPLKWLHTLFEPAHAETLYQIIFTGPEWPMLDSGTITDTEALARFLAAHPDIADDLRLAFSRWPECLSLIEETAALVPQLRARGYRTYVLSNFSPRFRKIQPDYPVFEHMNGILISAEEKLAKPDLKIYARLCEKFDLKPDECFFIDDMPANVQAAQEFGMGSIQYTDTPALFADLRMHNLITTL